MAITDNVIDQAVVLSAQRPSSGSAESAREIISGSRRRNAFALVAVAAAGGSK